jgi:hypothetical protein
MRHQHATVRNSVGGRHLRTTVATLILGSGIAVLPANAASASDLQIMMRDNVLGTGTGLVAPGSNDLARATSEVMRRGDMEYEKQLIEFFNGVSISPYLTDYRPIAIDKKLGERETALKLYRKDWSSTEDAVPVFYKGDCVQREPWIFPAQARLPRAVIIMVENDYTNVTDFIVPVRNTILIKLRLTKAEHGDRYFFKMVGEKMLDEHYCGIEDELGQLIGRYALER